MFGFKKKEKLHPLVEFCERADDALMLAYEQRDVRAVVTYFTHPLIDTILEEIKSGEDLTSEYGIAKYRIRSWDNVNEGDPAHKKIQKHVRHENVSIRGMIDIPVGDPFDEEWVIVTENGKMFVKDIRRI